MKECTKCHSKNILYPVVCQWKEVKKNKDENIAVVTGTLCKDCGYFKEMGGGWTPSWWVTKKEMENIK